MVLMNVLFVKELAETGREGQLGVQSSPESIRPLSAKPTQNLCAPSCTMGRKRKVNLQQTRVSVRYRSQLVLGYDELKAWANLNERPDPDDLRHGQIAMADLLVDYKQFCFDAHRALSHTPIP